MYYISAWYIQDLEQFGHRVNALSKELENSEIYNRDCNIGDAWTSIDSFSKRLTILENEAQVLLSKLFFLPGFWGIFLFSVFTFFWLNGSYKLMYHDIL